MLETIQERTKRHIREAAHLNHISWRLNSQSEALLIRAGTITAISLVIVVVRVFCFG